MQQRPSPLLHDYKVPGPKPSKKPKALQWFAVGAGLPLLGLLLLSIFNTGQDADTPQTANTLSAAEPGYELETVAAVQNLTAAPVKRALPVIELLPLFDTVKLTIGRGDTMDKLFRKHELNLGHLASIANLDEPRALFRRLKPGDEFDIVHEDGNIVSMYSVLDLTSALQIERGSEGFEATVIDRPIETRKRIAHGVIESSLYESGAESGLSDRVIMNMAGIFAWDVDFVLDIRKGDTFYVQYEEIWQDGKYVGDGEIIAAEFNNNGRSTQAVRFIDGDGRSDYFTPDGHSVRKAFLRSPVDFRVSSSFNPNRLHPVLKTRRPHRGVDYAAPRGTPIKASGDGKVIFRGTQNGYGKVVILQHGGNITTLYAHMSNFAKNVRNGTRVRQGQTIGFVGATGMVTGVHLHYEYRINGVHRNPRTVELPQAEPIEEKYRAAFLASVEPILEEFEDFKRTQVAQLSVD